MTPRDFIYWLQGHLEISGTNALSKKQVAEIRKHIKLVMSNESNRFHQPPEDFRQGIPRRKIPKGKKPKWFADISKRIAEQRRPEPTYCAPRACSNNEALIC